MIQEGIPLEAIDAALEEGIITREELYDIVIPPRTLSHRKAKGQSLTPDESDKLIRLLRIKAIALDTFQNKEKAERWLTKPSRVLGQERPIELIRTENGARLVEIELHNISWGLFV
jgi:putative toxin-antitoxin system antitoxin component (TIGR02293 family)